MGFLRFSRLLQFSLPLGFGIQLLQFCIRILALVFFFFLLIVSVYILHGTMVFYLAVGVQHVLILASNTVTALDMSLWKVRIQIFRGLHIGILLLRHLGIKEVEDKVGGTKQWKIDNRR